MRFVIGLAWLSSLGASVACNALSGVGDLRFEGGPSGIAGGGGTAPSSSIGAGGGAGSGADGGGGGSTSDEDCLDGVDNDGDGAADCADPDCNAGHECVDASPLGFGAPTLVVSTAWSAPPLACPDGSPADVELFSQPAVPGCTACMCALLESCSPPKMKCYLSSNCTSLGSDVTSTYDSGMCVDADPPIAPPSFSCELTDPPEYAGSCSVAGGGDKIGDTFAEQHSLCATGSGVGCAGGQVCVPRPSAEGPLCVVQAGSVACPASWPSSVQAWAAAVDDRMCSSCACSGPGGTCSGGSYAFFEPKGCLGSSIDVDSGTCVDVSAHADQEYSVLADLPTPVGGVCAASGGIASGAVTPTGPQTICCR